MKTTKTLALAAMTALSLGVGSAMAQSSAVAPNYNAPQATNSQATAPATQTQSTPQYGSSDHGLGVVGGYDTNPIGGGF